MVQTGGDCVGFLHSLQSVSIMHEVSISVVTGFFFSSGTKPTSHEQSVVQKERVGSLIHAVTGIALASHFMVVACPAIRPAIGEKVLGLGPALSQPSG
jgi:hypothetical protein